MKKKTKILLGSYILAALMTLSLFSWAQTRGLHWNRRTAEYSASLAFEEAVRGVEDLSAALAKSSYVTDSRMGARVCSEAFARASAAEAALATLPFATQELEKLSAFLNEAGDYAWSLCGQEEALNADQKRQLNALSQRAADFCGQLEELRELLREGEARMDSREQRLRNVGAEDTPFLSEELLALEDAFEPVTLSGYESSYPAPRSPSRGYLTEEEMLQAAADFLQVAPEALSMELCYEGLEGRRCYRWEDCRICVSRSGVESLSQSRLVGERRITEEEALALAKDFLAQRGYGDLALRESGTQGNLALFSFARTLDGALCQDSCLRISIALDDGSVYLFDACQDRAPGPGPDWPLDQETAAQALPEGLRVSDCSRRICRSPGGQEHACYAFSGTDEAGRQVQIWVDAATGKEWEILVDSPAA